MSENTKPNIGFSLVDEMPDTVERGMVYLSPSDENGFIKVGIDSTTAATIYDSSALVNKSDIGNAKIFYGTCDTAADVSIKDVSCLDFTSNDLVKGAAIFVTFNKTNSASADSLRLNVNNTGIIGLKKLKNATISTLSAVGELYSNSTHLFTYSGTNWVSMTTDYNTNTTYSGMTVAEYEAGTGTTARLITPARLKGAIEYWTEQNQADWDATTGLAQILNVPDWLLDKQENIVNVNTDMAAYNPYSYNYIFNRMEGGYRFTRPDITQNGITFGVSDLRISESEMPATEELYIPIVNATFSANDSSMHVFMDIVLNSGISLPASILTDDRDLADMYGYIRLDFIYEEGKYIPVYAFRSKNLSTLYDGVSRNVTNCTVSLTKFLEQYENNIWRISEDSYTNEYNVALPIKQEYRKSFYDCSVLSFANNTINLETDLSFRLIDGVTICINLDNKISSGRTMRLNVNDTGSRAIVNGISIVSYINSGTSILTYSETSDKWVYVSDMSLVGSGCLYIRKNGQNVIGKDYNDDTAEMMFNANIDSDVVYDISVNELPDVSTADNGKIMMVVNGQWSMVEPVAIYSGDGDPSNNLGKNGDLYLQTGK